MCRPGIAFACLLGFSVAGTLSSSGFGQIPGEKHLRPFGIGAFAAHNGRKEENSSNLLVNGEFEDGMKGWSVEAWARKGRAEVDSEERHEGHPSLRIFNSAADNTFVSQKVSVKPSTRYQLLSLIHI